MNTEKIIKDSKVIILVTLSIGIVLFVAGIIFSLMGISLIQNNRAFIGLSFIPLSVAFVY